jgi:hypothetical protein
MGVIGVKPIAMLFGGTREGSDSDPASNNV